MQTKLIILVGTSASGKSTYAKQLVRESRGKVIRVNRDDIRSMLFGLEEDHSLYYKSYDIKRTEGIVSSVVDDILISSSGVSIVLDNTNLKVSYINKAIANFGRTDSSVIIKVMSTPLETCIQRDKDRYRTVGEDIIRKQYKQLQSLLSNPEFISLQEKYR